MDKTNVVELIQKLLALSKSPNENEASLAMAKAQEMLIKYNLDMATIVTPENKDNTEDKLINEVVDFTDFETWQRTLLTAIANRNFCQSIKSGDDIHILGRKSNVRAVEAMYNWLEPQITRLIIESGYKRKDKTSYAYGIIITVSKKLDESKEQYQVNNPNSRALIVNIQSEVNNWMHNQYPHIRHTRQSINRAPYYHGQNDGHKVSVYNSSRQVSNRFLLT